LGGLLRVELLNLTPVIRDLVVELRGLLGLGQRPKLTQLFNAVLANLVLAQNHLGARAGFGEYQTKEGGERFVVLLQKAILFLEVAELLLSCPKLLFTFL